MKTLFKSEQGKQDIFRLYDEKLQELDIEYEYLKVNTSFGETNIIATGGVSKPPIILVHGSNGCAPIALETYPNLYKTHRVYAVDVLAQPNKSAETRLSMKDNSYGKWMNELIVAEFLIGIHCNLLSLADGGKSAMIFRKEPYKTRCT